MTARVLIVSPLLFLVTVYTVWPYVAARIDDRPMTTADHAQLTWGGLGIFIALFFLAVLIIGART